MPRTRKRPPTGRQSAAVSRILPGRVGWLLGSIFVGANLLLSAYFLDSVPSPNPTSRALPVLTLYEEGTYAIDTYEKFTMDKSFVNGHYYSDKAPLATWIVIPFYGLLQRVHLAEPGDGKPRWLPVTQLGDFLCGTIPFAIVLWIVFRQLAREIPAADAILLSMLPLYGSFIYAYAGVFMSHVLAGALLCGSYILLKRREHPSLCGFLLGLAVLAEFPTALALPIWAVAVGRRDRRQLVSFVLGGLPCAAALLVYNHAITGSYLTVSYNYIADAAFSEMRSGYGMTFPQPEAIWGLLFSTYRGMFFYAPGLAVVALAYLGTR